MSVQDLPDIRTRPIEKFFTTEKGARGYYWYYRTLVFAMFAEFSFGAAGRKNWMSSIFKIREEKKKGLKTQRPEPLSLSPSTALSLVTWDSRCLRVASQILSLLVSVVVVVAVVSSSIVLTVNKC